jgi:endo-1,4-beta-xylanase
VWHSQVPNWVFEDEEGNELSREALLERMKDHIDTVVGRYAGRVDAWDVVNEALNDDGSYRESRWYEIIGQDYLVKAFEYAREADPDAELYYNDYSLEVPSKRDGAVRLVEYLQENDAPITGIGTQGHFSLNWPPLNEVEQTITDFAALGIDVMVTELEIDVLPNAMNNMGADISASAELREELNPYPDALPDSVQQQLSDRYAELFEVYMEHRDDITRITFWGVTDGDTWKNNWPVQGRTNYPLLFNRQWEPKPAFDAVIDVAEQYSEE